MALDKFAHFFAGPLLLKDWVDKEIEAVDSGMYLFSSVTRQAVFPFQNSPKNIDPL